MQVDFQALGLNTIPCLPKDKRPAIAWKEYQTKKFEGTIGLDMNRAVICGITSGNLVVIDVDSPEVINEIFTDFETIKKKTLVVQTGSGGWHVYVKPKGKIPSTQRLTNSKNQHIDIQCNGTYVIAPGSTHPNGNKYEVKSSVTTIESVDLDAILAHLGTLGFVGTKEINIEDIARGGLVKGTKVRNDALFRLALHLMQTAKLPEDVAWDEIKRWNSTNIPPIPDSELKATFQSAAKRVKPEAIPISDVLQKIEFPNFKKLGEVSSQDEGKEVSFDAFVAAFGEIRTVTTLMSVKCSRCGIEFETESDGYVNPKMPICPQHKTKMEQKSILKTTDMVEVILQELPENHINNDAPTRIARVIGTDVFKLSLGDRVRVTGTFKSFTETGKKDNQVAILVNLIQCTEEPEESVISLEDLNRIKSMINEQFIVEVLVPSFANGLHGLEVAKEVCLLTLVAAYKMGDIRGDINTLLIGNPSKGKSVLLREFIDICHKGEFVNASTSSAAGLVYGMVKLPNGTSVPQAGPVVLMDGGFCALDELDKAPSQTHASLLEVMEQQSVSFDKAGGHRKQNARTAIIAAANPKGGKWDTDPAIKPMDNINLPQPLVSRNDWIVGLIFTNQLQRSRIADKILSKIGKTENIIIPKPLLKQYLNYVRNLEPRVSGEAAKKLKEFYMSMVTKMEGEGLPFEERQLEGLLRSSIARAKLLMKDEVDVKDVDAITDLYKKSLESLNLKIEGNYIQGIFDDDAHTKVNKERAFMKTWAMCEDENGMVEDTHLFMKLIEHHPKHFPDALVCKKFFKQFEGTKILIDGKTGKYRMRM